MARTAADDYGTLARIARRAAYAGPAKPLPVATAAENLRHELERVNAALATALEKISQLEKSEARMVERIGLMQIRLQETGRPTEQRKREATIAQVQEAFLVALATERYTVAGDTYLARHFVSDRRHKIVSRPRQVAMYLCWKLTGQSLPAIGRKFGNRDHTTVMHAKRNVDRIFEQEPILRRAADRVLAQFGGAH